MLAFLQVHKSDDTSKLCQQCFGKIDRFSNIRERSAGGSVNHATAATKNNNNASNFAVEVVDLTQAIDSDGETSHGEGNTECEQPTIMCITITDTESENEDVKVNLLKLNLQLKSSKKQRDKQFPIECHWKCNASFENTDALMYHVKTYHAFGFKKTIECYLCKRLYPSHYALQLHMNRVHSRRKSFMCSFSKCSKIFYSKCTLTKHMLVVHSKHDRFPANRKRSCKKISAIVHASAKKHSVPIKCNQCMASFRSSDEMRYHKKKFHTSGIKNTYECHLCRKKLSSRINIKLHMNAVHAHKKCFICPISTCSQVFYYNRYALTNHMILVHRRKGTLPATHKNRAIGGREKEQNQAKTPVKCERPFCNQLFESVGAWNYHVEHYHARGVKNTFECHLCKKPMREKAFLLRHMNGVHFGQQMFLCPFRGCSAKLSRKDHLKRHITMVHSKTMYPCDVCNRPFTSAEALRGHNKRTHYSQTRFKCRMPSCSKVFSRKAILREHVLNDHRDLFGKERTFCCHICKTSSPSQWLLRSHINHMHLYRKDLKCPIATCSKRFKKNAYLEQHLASKHGKGSVQQCHICKTVLSSKYALQTHMTVHGVEQRFKCPKPMCTATYQFKSDLDEHLRKKHGEKPMIFCPVCRKAMENRKMLLTHIKHKHSNTR